jgi:hypothetical protein
MWANHHEVFSQIDKVDRTFLMINIFFLMAVAFVPFPTILVAEHLRDAGLENAALAYGFRLTVTAVFYNLLWFYGMAGRRLLREDADPHVVSGITRSFLPGPWIYLISTLVAFWKPTVSIVLYAAIAAPSTCSRAHSSDVGRLPSAAVEVARKDAQLVVGGSEGPTSVLVYLRRRRHFRDTGHRSVTRGCLPSGRRLSHDQELSEHLSSQYGLGHPRAVSHVGE